MTVQIPALGAKIRKALPDVTWQRVPEPMLRRLVEIEKVERRQRREADTGADHHSEG